MYTTAEYYQSILDNLMGGFLSVSLEGLVVYINPTAGKILHLPAIGALIGKDYAAALGGFPALCGVVREALATHQTVHRAEVSVMHGDAPLVIGYSTFQVKNRKGAYLGLGIIFQDLTFVQLKKP
ncbi:MAG: PAS domain-containing protein [Elusimicrobiota bacterium]